MRIDCLIDSLGPGGAQRQMSLLVKTLVGRGHDVRLLAYHEQDHFLAEVESVGVVPMIVKSGTKLGRLVKMRRAIRQLHPDCIIAFLSTPSFIGLFSSVGWNRIPIVVSERSLSVQENPQRCLLRFNAFRIADRIVCNSQTQADFISQRFRFLTKRVEVIRNCIDLEEFHPQDTCCGSDQFSILVGASIRSEKNAKRFVHAVRIVNNARPGAIRVDWYGSNFFRGNEPTVASKYYLETVDLIQRLKLQSCFRFHAPVPNLHSLFAMYDAACLPSVIEGCPNFVCEAMASGVPVIASKVSDIPALIGSRELLFDPRHPEDMARTIMHLLDMEDKRRQQIATRNRNRAEEMFSVNVFGNAFDSILDQIAR